MTHKLDSYTTNVGGARAERHVGCCGYYACHDEWPEGVRGGDECGGRRRVATRRSMGGHGYSAFAGLGLVYASHLPSVA